MVDAFYSSPRENKASPYLVVNWVGQLDSVSIVPLTAVTSDLSALYTNGHASVTVPENLRVAGFDGSRPAHIWSISMSYAGSKAAEEDLRTLLQPLASGFEKTDPLVESTCFACEFNKQNGVNPPLQRFEAADDSIQAPFNKHLKLEPSTTSGYTDTEGTSNESPPPQVEDMSEASGTAMAITMDEQPPSQNEQFASIQHFMSLIDSSLKALNSKCTSIDARVRRIENTLNGGGRGKPRETQVEVQAPSEVEQARSPAASEDGRSLSPGTGAISTSFGLSPATASFVNTSPMDSIEQLSMESSDLPEGYRRFTWFDFGVMPIGHASIIAKSIDWSDDTLLQTLGTSPDNKLYQFGRLIHVPQLRKSEFLKRALREIFPPAYFIQRNATGRVPNGHLYAAKSSIDQRVLTKLIRLAEFFCPGDVEAKTEDLPRKINRWLREPGLKAKLETVRLANNMIKL